MEEACRKIIIANSPSLIENNRQFYALLVECVDVTFRKNGEIKTEKAMIVDFDNPERNKFLAVNQFTIIENEERRPDVVIFVNGLPLVVVELKSASDENVSIENAYNQIQTYKHDIPALVKQLNNPTIVVITDRNDLDEQLYTTFAKSEDILRQTPKQAHVRKLIEEQKKQQAKDHSKEQNGLYDLLHDRESGGIIFTTIQKFKPEDGEMLVLTDRRNVIIIADEAHRSRYGLEAKTDGKTGKVKHGYAKYLRDALPNASLISASPGHRLN